MAPLTLIEASKHAANDGRVVESAIIEEFARSTDILRVLPWKNIDGASYTYRREDMLPAVGYRGINEGFIDSYGIVNPQTEPLRILGGDITIDAFVLDTMGVSEVDAQIMMKAKAMALSFTRDFIKGDSRINPRVIDGLQSRVTGSQLVDNGGVSANAGAPLSLAKLDQAIDQCDEPGAILMNKAMRRRFSALMRNQTLAGNVMLSRDEFGRPMTSYNDLPILIADYDNNGDDILPFTEAASDGTTLTSTSLYVMSFGEMKLTGLQGRCNGVYGINTRMVTAEKEAQPQRIDRLEWYNAIAIRHGRSVVRLYGITDGAITA